MTDATLRRFARLVFPSVSTKTAFKAVPHGIRRLCIPCLKPMATPLRDNFWLDVPIDPCQLGRHTFNWGYNAELDLLAVAL